MTDEKVEEYLKINECEVNGVYDSEEKLSEAESYCEGYNEGLGKGYLDGLAKGKPKWHDLRKYPNYLPKYNEEDDEDNFYLVAFRNWYDKEEIITREFIWNGTEFCEEDYSKIPYFKEEGILIAWCELPKFEEIDK